ncbi:MAG: chromosome segregation protein [Solirubrobacterales bacterium]|jgi:chromosome segregation ATPase|nr:chromosome segregation protein [Solirubrobacterales bacterium]
MHLQSISIKGFKSFPDRTNLEFAPGVSVIVGPNGCGKSNVTDAVLWALGEQSPLSVRGQSMQDMVYTGGEGVGPSRYAEVEVILATDEGDDEPLGFSEISIRRRLDRAGDGEYRLNGARCRLADVVDVLSDMNLGGEMHSVISQGRVEEIVNSKPRHRRILVEEAAGLSKHRKRRRRAQLRLERTQDNLDRALDVEREARRRLRPLKQQAQAADIHTRLERESNELRAQLLAAEAGAGADELAAAEKRANQARKQRDAVEADLAVVTSKRSEIEARLADRDRERTEAWGRLTSLRAAGERLSARADALAARRDHLRHELERRRSALGALAAEIAAEAEREGGDPVDVGLGRAVTATREAFEALGRAQAAEAEAERATEVSRARDSLDLAARTARRVEDLLGRRRQDSIERRITIEGDLLKDVEALCEAAATARDATGKRASALEARTLSQSESDETTAALRECSRQDAEIQARLRSAAEEVTQAEVRAAHLRDRSDEAAGELKRISEALGREIAPSAKALADTERAEIDSKLERLARRREALGPVNPLAEREYEEATTYVSELEEQRTDLEAAMKELQGLIAETDRKITADFEETFEAARKNFEELIEHLFPGGRGRLRLVTERTPKPVIGGGEAPAAEGEAPDDDPDEEAQGDFEGHGVEIEVTPAGKAMRKLQLLSGGEKSLVALAFVFSVFMARPSPFYILDEVEAALDDANIDRFLQLVRRFSDRAQFIVVTHQKRTMDAADVLYGVSMARGGITKVVSRRMPATSEQTLEDAA